MSTDVVALTKRTLHRLNTQVGHTTKTRHVLIRSAVALDILARAGFTIDFKPESDENRKRGFRTIWEYILYHYPLDDDMRPIIDPTDRDRWEAVREHVDVVKQGFHAVKRQLQDDWRKITLYMLPRASSKCKLEVITAYPTYQVNDDQTALQIEDERANKQFRGQLKSTVERKYAVAGDAKVVVDAVLAFTQDLLAAGLPPPRMEEYGELPYDEEGEANPGQDT